MTTVVYSQLWLGSKKVCATISNKKYSPGGTHDFSRIKLSFMAIGVSPRGISSVGGRLNPSQSHREHVLTVSIHICDSDCLISSRNFFPYCLYLQREESLICQSVQSQITDKDR